MQCPCRRSVQRCSRRLLPWGQRQHAPAGSALPALAGLTAAVAAACPLPPFHLCAAVQSVRPFGVFVKIDGFRKYGLVHFSQASVLQSLAPKPERAHAGALLHSALRPAAAPPMCTCRLAPVAMLAGRCCMTSACMLRAVLNHFSLLAHSCRSVTTCRSRGTTPTR